VYKRNVRNECRCLEGKREGERPPLMGGTINMDCKELACGSSIKDWKFLDVLKNYQIIKKFTAPWKCCYFRLYYYYYYYTKLLLLLLLTLSSPPPPSPH